MTDRGNDVRIIALMNQKGGVGKTTTTVNLAAAIAERGRRVLVVDLDPQAHLTLHLGIDPSDLDHSVYDLLIDDDLTAEAVLQEAGEHLHVLPAEVDLAAAEQDLSNTPDRQRRLKQKLAPIAHRYDFILFDCPPSLGLLTLNALAAADEVIVPMQAHFLALQGLSKLLETVQLVRQSVNTTLRVSGVVLAMHEGQTNLATEVVADLEQFFVGSRKLAMPWSEAVVYQPPIRRNIKLAECPSFGQTIFQYAPHSAGAFDYSELASAIALPAPKITPRLAPRLAPPTATETAPKVNAVHPPAADDEPRSPRDGEAAETSGNGEQPGRDGTKQDQTGDNSSQDGQSGEYR
ncbi:MAG: AAA family ATPase, partial [Phycisphaeraceae bacterium]